jgi:GTP-binding protein EngB required for normal cell division
MYNNTSDKKETRESERSLSALLDRAKAATGQLGTGFTRHVEKLDDLQQRFLDGRFHLAVLGQFKRGKSTLLNALVGEPILPIAVIPLTAAPTFLQYGTPPRVAVTFQGKQEPETFSGSSTAERSAFLARYVTEEGNPKNRLGVQEVTVYLPAKILASGVVLIDTPGIGSTYKHNTQATLDFLEQCDAALFLVSADPPITEVELDFLAEVRKKVPRLFYVLSKIDYLNDAERKQALAFYEKTLCEHGCVHANSSIFCISARTAIEGRDQGREDAWETSGMAELERFLVEYLAKEKFKALSHAICLRTIGEIETSLMESTISLQALKLPQKELQEKITLFEQTLKQASRERNLIQDVLEGDKRRMLAFLEEQAQELREEATQVLKDIMNQSSIRRFGKSTQKSIQDAWAESIPEYFAQKQSELNEKTKARLLECLAPHDDRLNQLIETLRHTAADLFQVPYRPMSRDEALELKRKPYWVLNTWNTDPLPMLKSIDQRLEELVRRNVENIRWSMLQNLNISFAHFARKITERLDETVAATKGAMESAHERKKTHGGSIEAVVAELSQNIQHLDGIKQEFESMLTNLSTSSS